MNLIYQEIMHVFVNRYLVYFRMWTNTTAVWVMFDYNMGYPRANVLRRSGPKPGASVLIPPGYLHPGKYNIPTLHVPTLYQNNIPTLYIL
jgi:hypothetical protein